MNGLRSFLLLGLVIVISCNNENKTSSETSTTDTVVKEQVEVKKEVTILPGRHPAEDSIVLYLAEILYMRKKDKYEELDNENRLLMEYMKRVCEDATALQYSFDSLHHYNGMMVLTSEDRKFRIYCWDTETGGTMHFYNAIAQYKTEAGSKAYILNDIAGDHEEGGSCGFWYSQIHSIKANGDKTYYLPIYYGRYSGIEFAEGINAYEIEGNKLTMPLIFKPKGKPLNEIIYDYTSGTVDKESSNNGISLSDDKKTLSIPITDKDRVVTDRSLIYKFDGDKFVYDKNAH